jgi:ATP synthase protein I
MSAPDPKELRELGNRLDAVQRQHAERDKGPPPTSLGIAFRFSTEMVAALVVGGGIGWGIDWMTARWSPIHTKPWGMILFFVLGAAAGILNVIRAARELNAEITAKSGK